MQIPTFSFEILCFLASFMLYYLPGMLNYLKWFNPFLLITLIIEVVGYHIYERGGNNNLLYSIWTAAEFVFYLLILRKIIYRRRAKRAIGIAAIAYAVIAGVNIGFIQRDSFHSITYALGCLVIVAVCFYYFLELFRLAHSVNLIREPAFWICSGLLFYYTCGFPLVGLLNFMKSMPLLLMNSIGVILTTLNILLYSSFTISFLCRIRLKKRHAF